MARLRSLWDAAGPLAAVSFLGATMITVAWSFARGHPFVFTVDMNRSGEGWFELALLAVAVAWAATKLPLGKGKAREDHGA